MGRCDRETEDQKGSLTCPLEKKKWKKREKRTIWNLLWSTQIWWRTDEEKWRVNLRWGKARYTKVTEMPPSPSLSFLLKRTIELQWVVGQDSEWFQLKNPHPPIGFWGNDFSYKTAIYGFLKNCIEKLDYTFRNIWFHVSWKYCAWKR